MNLEQKSLIEIEQLFRKYGMQVILTNLIKVLSVQGSEKYILELRKNLEKALDEYKARHFAEFFRGFIVFDNKFDREEFYKIFGHDTRMMFANYEPVIIFTNFEKEELEKIDTLSRKHNGEVQISSKYETLEEKKAKS